MTHYKIAAVVILYRPQKQLLTKNILSYLDEVESVLLIDNTDSSCTEFLSAELCAISPKIGYISMNGNKGIAAALNTGIKRCCEAGFHWILTMDQDSHFITPLNGYADFLDSQESHDDIAILAPRYRIEGERENGIPTQPFALKRVMQSGNLLNAGIFRQTNGFREDYFIDYVDYDYCMHVRRFCHARILCIPEVVLCHRPGTLSHRNILGLKYNFISQSPIRYYYTFRNGIDYVLRHRDWHQSVILCKGVAKALLLEHDKKSKIGFLLKGIRDYFRNKWGAYRAND